MKNVRLFSIYIFGIFAVAALAFAAFVFTPQPIPTATAQNQPEIIAADGGGEYPNLPSDQITETQRKEIQRNIQRNIKRLEGEGKLTAPQNNLLVLFDNPVRKAAGNPDFNVDGISNYVDHNPAFPNQITDYNCGNRSYDQASGYNHSGIDIFTHPFSWNKMDNNEVEAVAAAPGTIVFKSNGNPDRSCSFNGNSWNAVYIRHADNSVAWYGHLKNNSLTSKIVGDTVATGERLGVVGSSGNSTGPHLHFELYNAANQLQDPFAGTCNTTNNFTWWAQQEPYRNSRINRLMTHSAAPVFPACPNPEITNEKIVYRANDPIIVAAYFRDQLINDQTQFSILRPDNSVYQTWTHVSPNTYSASYWFYNRTLPADAQAGTWRFRIVYKSVTYDQTFVVSRGTQFDFDGDAKADVSVFRPSNGVWYLNRSTAGFSSTQFGAPTDAIAPADFDGDGKTDIGVYRNGSWYILRSSNGTIQSAGFGIAGDFPRPADFDGDGLADIAVWRPSTGAWYRLNSSNGAFVATQFGANGDTPVIGDFDGDTRTDLAVFRPSNGVWYIQRSTSGFLSTQFGANGDIPAPADFDGDSKSDINVFRPSNGSWYRFNSGNGAFVATQFGSTGDSPTAADYDGDGKADISVFRPSNGAWYRFNSSNGSFSAVQFGANNDKPVPAAFVQ